MELNAEQVKKALECIARKGDVLCAGCDYRKYDGLACHRIGAENALSLITSQEQRIKELTEENERLRADNIYGLSASNLAKKVEKLSYENEQLKNRVVCKVVIPDEKLEEIKNECLERVELDIKAIKADTVRKMQERLKKDFLEYKHDATLTYIDQIAKELIGENK